MVQIGIVDSMQAPPQNANLQGNFLNGETYVQSSKDDTSPDYHGAHVSIVLSNFAPGAEFKPYQVVNDPQNLGPSQFKLPSGNIEDAISDARSDQTDIVNLSVGIHHDDETDRTCGGTCPVANEVQEAINEDNLLVVVATGNAKTDDTKDVYCPAILDDVIAVGGMVSVCNSDPCETNQATHCWVRPDPNNPNMIKGPLCGQQGCINGKSCDDNCYEYQWVGNVSFRHTSPDVLAPVHYPVKINSSPLAVKLRMGTSYATPIVAGLLGDILSDIHDQTSTIFIDDILQAIQDSGTAIPDGSVPKFNDRGTRNHLGL